jgi:hypothetical protein
LMMMCGLLYPVATILISRKRRHPLVMLSAQCGVLAVLCTSSSYTFMVCCIVCDQGTPQNYPVFYLPEVLTMALVHGIAAFFALTALIATLFAESQRTTESSDRTQPPRPPVY